MNGYIGYTTTCMTTSYDYIVYVDYFFYIAMPHVSKV